MILAILFYLGITNTVGSIRRAALSLTFLDDVNLLGKELCINLKEICRISKLKYYECFPYQRNAYD